MFQMTLFIECISTEEAMEVFYQVESSIAQDVTSSEVISNEVYWKIDSQYTLSADFQTKDSIDIVKAEIILQKIADKWIWNGAKDSAHSSVNRMQSVFINDKIKFATVWFEELEELYYKDCCE